MKTPEEIKHGLECCASVGACISDRCEYYLGGNLMCTRELARDAMEYINELEAKAPRWISVKDRIPDNEVDVMVCVTRKHYSDPSKYIRFVAKAFHTDGRTNTEDSQYIWDTENIDMDYDEESDAYVIPEGWWESVEYSEEFSAIDDFVTHWMPLPEAPEEG